MSGTAKMNSYNLDGVGADSVDLKCMVVSRGVIFGIILVQPRSNRRQRRV